MNQGVGAESTQQVGLYNVCLVFRFTDFHCFYILLSQVEKHINHLSSSLLGKKSGLPPNSLKKTLLNSGENLPNTSTVKFHY